MIRKQKGNSRDCRKNERKKSNNQLLDAMYAKRISKQGMHYLII
jgi:hypothetical protein